MALLEVKNLKKTYTSKLSGQKIEALKNINLSVEKGEYVAIMGESGSGKTTLLNILATIDSKTDGEILYSSVPLGSMSEKQRAAFRRDRLGFVFQDFNLLDTLSVEDNIFLPLVLANAPYKSMKERADAICRMLGIQDLMKKYSYEISGGQKQRVAVARAMMTNPDMIFADEPTGALDSKSTQDLLSVFHTINMAGQTILMVTHSVFAASHANRVLFIKDGEIFHQIHRGDMDNNQLYKKIQDSLTVIMKSGDKA